MRAIGLGLNLYDASDAEQAHAIDALVGAYIDSCHSVHKGSSEAQDKLKAQSNAVKMVEDVLAPQLRKNPGHKFATGDSLTIADICMAAFYCELTLHDCNRATYSKILMTQELQTELGPYFNRLCQELKCGPHYQPCTQQVDKGFFELFSVGNPIKQATYVHATAFECTLKLT